MQKVNKDIILFSGATKLTVIYPRQILSTYIMNFFCFVLTEADLLLLHRGFQKEKKKEKNTNKTANFIFFTWNARLIEKC